MRRGLTLLLLLAAPALLAGCFGEDRSPVDVTPYLPQHDAEPGATLQVPFFLNSTFTFKQNLTLRVGELPAGWTYRLPADHVLLPGHKGRHVHVEITPSTDAAHGPRDVEVFVGDTRARVQVNVRPLDTPLRAGAGVNLSYVRLDANGTVLAHHEPMLRDRAGLKYAPNATAPAAPLLAYLGGPDETGAPPAYEQAGYRRLPPAVEEKLLAAKVGQTLLVDAADLADADPLAGADPAGKLLLRILRLQEPAPPTPPADASGEPSATEADPAPEAAPDV